jgi:hypothetical protein
MSNPALKAAKSRPRWVMVLHTHTCGELRGKQDWLVTKLKRDEHPKIDGGTVKIYVEPDDAVEYRREGQFLVCGCCCGNCMAPVPTPADIEKFEVWGVELVEIDTENN